MITYLYTLFLGVVVAIVSSLPVGPLNMSIVQTTLNRGVRSGFLMGLGGVIAEIIFCFIALFGFGMIFGTDNPTGSPDAESNILNYIYLGTIPILVILGIVAIKNRYKEEDPNQKSKAHNDMLLGFTLCISNPFLLGYWISATAALQSWGYLGSAPMEYVLFTAGVAAGILLFFLAIIRITSRSHKKLSLKTRGRINLVFGLFFIGFAVFLLVRYIVML